MDNEAKFTVHAENPNPPLVRQTLMFQWQVRGPGLTNFVNIAGATNDTLTFTHVTTNDVAYYRVNVTGSVYTNSTTTSEPAQLLVWTTNSPLLVFGSPVVRSGNLPTVGSCSGAFVGFVSFTKGSAWGWQGSGTRHQAKDVIGTGTIVVAYGFEDDLLCDRSPLDIHHTPPPPYGVNREDSKYQFAIYFTTNSSPSSVPTDPYSISLIGFNP
jgi:hypothetical protein